MELSFLLARPGDVEMLIGMMRQLREDDPEEGAFNEANARRATPPLLADPSIGRIWIIQCDGAPVGYVALTLDWSLEFGGRIAFVDELFVKRECRGRGVGTRTLAFIDEKAAALGVNALLLECTCANDTAKRLYEKCRFVDRGHRLMVKRIHLES